MEKLELIIAAIMVLLGFLGVGKVIIEKLKKEIAEALDKSTPAIDKIREYRKETSAGGKKLTPEEIKEVLPLAMDALVEWYDVVEVVVNELKKKKKK